MPVNIECYGSKAYLKLSGDVTIEEVPELVDLIIYNMTKTITLELDDVRKLNPDVALIIEAAQKTMRSYGREMQVHDPGNELEEPA